jgi:serine phosphatase RsbU (regulator of sigma subunit)
MSFRGQLSLTISLLCALTIVVLSGYFLIIQNGQLREQFNQTIESELKTLEFLSSRAILDQDDFALNDSLNNLKSLNGFMGSEFYNRNGTTLLASIYTFDKSQSQFPDKFLMENSSLLVSADDHDVIIFNLTIVHPFIKKSPPTLGFARVSFSDRHIRDQIFDSFLLVIVSTIIVLMIAFLAASQIAIRMSKPIMTLSNASAKVAKGDLSFSVNPIGSIELKELMSQFNAMISDLNIAREERDEQLVVNEQIRQAQEIQEGMNPARFMKKPDVEIKGFTRAAKGVGGDYYDFRLLPDGRYALLICDVTGKSISASLVMVLIKTIFSTWLKLYDQIRTDQILELINKVMSAEAHIDKLASILFCIYNPISKEMEFSNGGHGPLYLFRAKDLRLTGSQQPGMPMGIDEDGEYSISKIILEPGDIVLLFTDGVTEARNLKKDEYGLHRLSYVLGKCWQLDAREITKKIIADVDNFAGEATQHDDITLLTLRVPG